MSNEPDRDKRRALEESRIRLLDEHLNPIYLEAAEIDRDAVRQLGAPNYYELYKRFGFRLDDLAAECRAVLDETEKLWEREGDRLFRSRLGIGLSDARPWDVARLFRAPDLDQLYPPDRMLPALETTLGDLGVDLHSQQNVHLDLESRPSKTPRAFCAPIEVPGKVMLVIQPIGGKDDWEALFHEAGHTEHYAHTSGDLPMEDRRLGDMAVTEGWAACARASRDRHGLAQPSARRTAARGPGVRRRRLAARPRRLRGAIGAGHARPAARRAGSTPTTRWPWSPSARPSASTRRRSATGWRRSSSCPAAWSASSSASRSGSSSTTPTARRRSGPCSTCWRRSPRRAAAASSAVFGSAGERDTAKRPLMGRIAAERARLVVVTDEDPRGEDRDAILDEIARGAEAGGKRRGHDLLLIADRRAAIEAAFERARPGDIVLLAGQGPRALDHRRRRPRAMGRTVGGRGEPFVAWDTADPLLSLRPMATTSARTKTAAGSTPAPAAGKAASRAPASTTADGSAPAPGDRPRRRRAATSRTSRRSARR